AKRVIEFLRDRMGVPLEWDAFGQGYRIRCPARRTDDTPRELPGLWFTDQEVDGLLTMCDLIAEADDTGQVRQSLLPLRRRLRGMLGASRYEMEALLKRANDAAYRQLSSQGLRPESRLRHLPSPGSGVTPHPGTQSIAMALPESGCS
ncbi:MAG TPA: hypothetical protein DCF63_15010, partial [Planctomycetaceae bacterium]|nr:hypothetical protein [Planctomycetaceae bacterium]